MLEACNKESLEPSVRATTAADVVEARPRAEYRECAKAPGVREKTLCVLLARYTQESPAETAVEFGGTFTVEVGAVSWPTTPSPSH